MSLPRKFDALYVAFPNLSRIQRTVIAPPISSVAWRRSRVKHRWWWCQCKTLYVGGSNCRCLKPSPKNIDVGQKRYLDASYIAQGVWSIRLMVHRRLASIVEEDTTNVGLWCLRSSIKMSHFSSIDKSWLVSSSMVLARNTANALAHSDED